MSPDSHNTDELILQLGGCGLFQVLLSSTASLTYSCAAFTMIFMSFGMHNPGLRCRDNLTTTTTYRFPRLISPDNLTADRFPRLISPDNLTADRFPRLISPDNLTADRFPRLISPDNLTADRFPRLISPDNLTADRFPRLISPDNLTADRFPRLISPDNLTADRFPRLISPDNLTADRFPRLISPDNLTADRFPRLISPDNLTADDGLMIYENPFTDICVGLETCERTEFSPEASTIVTEWGLICGDAWKVSAIASVQMAGMTIGHLVSGYLGDAYGRKSTLMVNVTIQAVLTLLSVASMSWEMFATLKFLIGVSCGVIFCISNVYMTEIVTPKWRAIIPSIPMWVFGCVVFSLCAMAFKDWRQLHIVNGLFTIVLVVPLYFLPESLRWLVVKKKEKKSSRAVEIMAKLNRSGTAGEDRLTGLVEERHSKQAEATTILSFLCLFKKGYIRYTLILSFVLFVSNLFYFSSSFGVSSLPGDLYINNIIVYTTDIPGNFVAWFAPNAFGRKPTDFVVGIVQASSLAVFMAFDHFTLGKVREIGVLAFVVLTRVCCDVGWFVVLTYAAELFPTVIRAAAVGWMMFVSGVAAAVSPYLVISVETMYVSYLVIVALSLAGGLAFLFMPETRGKVLPDDLEYGIEAAGIL